MPLHADKTDNAKANQENQHSKIAVAKTRVVPKARPALDDVGNKLNNAQAAKKDPKKAVGNVAVVKKRPALGDVGNKIKNENVKPPPTTQHLQQKNLSIVHKSLIEDPDIKEDPMMSTEYVNDIFEYLRSLEDKFAIAENHLEGQFYLLIYIF